LKTRAIYSGTFDPITKGHLDILKRALKIYNEVIIAVANSSSKKPMFTISNRIKLIKKATRSFNCVVIKSFDNLLVEFAKNENVYSIIRGLRTTTDFEYELQMSYANNSLDNRIDSIFLMPTLKNAFVSSSVVRELINFDGNFDHLIPKRIHKKIKKIIRKKGIK
jgi:pantetheine-phosphate adenylyltransferase